VAVPWIVRNALTFDGGGLRQTLENAWLTTNTDIFAFADRPSLATFLAQGPVVIVGHIAAALVHDLVDVLIVPAAPVGIVGLLAVVALRRTPAVREPGLLRALLLGGLITFLVTSVVFPVATLWGTFQHASGPLLVALIVLSALGLDALIVRVRSWRGWSRENAWLAPLATLGLSVPVAVLSVALVAAGATSIQQRFGDPRYGVPPEFGPVITDHPMWVSVGTGVQTLAYPRDGDAAVLGLAAAFGAHWLLLSNDGVAGPSDACFASQKLPSPQFRLIEIQTGCVP
jgi:hypothetical protein